LRAQLCSRRGRQALLRPTCSESILRLVLTISWPCHWKAMTSEPSTLKLAAAGLRLLGSGAAALVALPLPLLAWFTAGALVVVVLELLVAELLHLLLALLLPAPCPSAWPTQGLQPFQQLSQ
jgi:hypothetical protein